MSLPKRRVAAVAFVLSLLLASVAEAAPRQQRRAARFPQGRAKDATRHARAAAEVVRQIMSVPDRAIPRDLIEGAEAVVVCPGVLKAAFIVGGRKGHCVISRRTPRRQWGAPVFYNMTGGSFGAQIGGVRTDYVLLFMNEDALRGLLEDKLEIGGEAGVAAGPVGRTIGASTTPTLDAGILSYSRSKGLFAGAALKGVAITPDNDLNEAFYGRKAAELIEAGGDFVSPPAVRVLPLQLSRYSARPAR
ncbi:MAG TPA: lipid-binding SYLF domain-containing protein [Pyrinomonadaceae bacterium]|nr:lipid-binding SYLF domain-containing protein [Pyrinomonadaceae bacterium]